MNEQGAAIDLHGVLEAQDTLDRTLRSEQREWAQLYLRGQLSDLERKSIEPMVLRERGQDVNAVRAVQQFIGEGAWDDDRILEKRQRLVAQDLGEPEGTVILDGSGFPKKGEHSVGVQRQYCGALGKIANCQQGVFLAYASSRGYTFLDRRLYLPKSWFDKAHAAKRKKCGVPKDLVFKNASESCSLLGLLCLEIDRMVGEDE
jgi:SRSO17 transposase